MSEIVLIGCKLSGSAFSGEKIFRFDTAEDGEYVGVAPVGHCFDDKFNKIGRGPAKGTTVDGFVEAFCTSFDEGGKARVELPDGEAAYVPPSLVRHITTQRLLKPYSTSTVLPDQIPVFTELYWAVEKACRACERSYGRIPVVMVRGHHDGGESGRKVVAAAHKILVGCVNGRGDKDAYCTVMVSGDKIVIIKPGGPISVGLSDPHAFDAVESHLREILTVMLEDVDHMGPTIHSYSI